MQKKVKIDKFLYLEACYNEDSIDEKYDFKIYDFQPGKVAIFGRLRIYIIDVFNWQRVIEISIPYRKIKNSYSFGVSCFLLLFDCEEKKTNDNEGNLNAPANEISIIKIFL